MAPKVIVICAKPLLNVLSMYHCDKYTYKLPFPEE